MTNRCPSPPPSAPHLHLLFSCATSEGCCTRCAMLKKMGRRVVATLRRSKHLRRHQPVGPTLGGCGGVKEVMYSGDRTWRSEMMKTRVKMLRHVDRVSSIFSAHLPCRILRLLTRTVAHTWVVARCRIGVAVVYCSMCRKWCR